MSARLKIESIDDWFLLLYTILKIIFNVIRNEIVNASINQAHSLIHFKLIYEEKFFSFYIKNLPALINLQKLKLIQILYVVP